MRTIRKHEWIVKMLDGASRNRTRLTVQHPTGPNTVGPIRKAPTWATYATDDGRRFWAEDVNYIVPGAQPQVILHKEARSR